MRCAGFGVPLGLEPSFTIKVPIQIEENSTEAASREQLTTNVKIRAGVPNRRTDQEGSNMSQNHYVTKRKRRPKNNNRKDPSAATMAKLRKRASAEKKSAD